MMSNSTDGLNNDRRLEKGLFITMTMIPCCIFYTVNIFMLYILRSKPVFRETSRFVLLFNLLFADTFNLAISQIMFLMASLRVRLTYPVCGVLISINILASSISPVTLVVMSMERYVAVCFPLQHSRIVTMRSTSWAILFIWTYCTSIVVVRVGLMFMFPFHELDSLLMERSCEATNLYMVPLSAEFDEAYQMFIFILSATIIVVNLFGVTVAARSFSENQSSARKIRYTMTLHVFQLVLSLLSTMFNRLLMAVYKSVPYLTFLRIQNVLYICLFICPHCLSSLIYCLRDSTIRPVLLRNLGCGVRVSIRAVKMDISTQN